MAFLVLPSEESTSRSLNIRFNFEYHHVKEKVFTRIDNALAKSELFGLKCKSSLVIFSPALKKAYWFGKELAEFQYPDWNAFLNGIKFQLLSHNDFVGQQKIIEVKHRTLIEFGNIGQPLYVCKDGSVNSH